MVDPAVRRIAIRADGSRATGLGHVSRCLALAERLVQHGLHVELLSMLLPPQMSRWAKDIGVRQRLITATPGSTDDAVQLIEQQPDVSIIDGYRFSRAFFQVLSEQASAHVVVDDNGDTPALTPSLIINQNPHGSRLLYSHVSSSTGLLLGLRYALIRSTIVNARRTRSEYRPVSTTMQVLVSLGGTDPRDLTIPVASALRSRGIGVIVAIGPAVPEPDLLKQRLSMMGVEVVDQIDYVDALSSCSVAVIGAGSTMWEAAYLGVPAIAVIVASNQVGACAAAAALGFAQQVDGRSTDAPNHIATIAEHLLQDALARSSMSVSGQHHVDGAGSNRVAETIVGYLR